MSKIVIELRPTDWILQRWAASIGDGLYDCPWEVGANSKIPPLDDQCAIAVDQLVLRADKDTKRLISLWYRTAWPKSEIARRIGVHRDTIYVRWNAALWHFRGAFVLSPLSRLRQAALADVEFLSDTDYDQSTSMEGFARIHA